MDIDFSIIVVTYNRNELLKNCLINLKNQTWKNFEVIVIDRGSEPSAEFVVADVNDNRFRYERSSQRIHFCDVVNEAVTRTKGKYLCIFGDDDVLNKNTLELVNLAFNKNLDCDITVIGSASVMKGQTDSIHLPSHFSNDKNFPYFKAEKLTHKFSGKEWIKWVLSAQFIGPKMECHFPSYIHPSVFFLRKSDNFYNVIKKQEGIAIKPSFDCGYLGLAYYTNLLYINAPLATITFGIDNVSIANRRFWDEETKDVKYMPKISQLENRGADSMLNMIYKNKLENEYDLTIQRRLYRMILKSIAKDPIWDFQTVKDYVSLFSAYNKVSKYKIDMLCNYLKSILLGLYLHFFAKNKLIKTFNKLDCINALEANNALDIIFKKQIDLIKENLINSNY